MRRMVMSDRHNFDRILLQIKLIAMLDSQRVQIWNFANKLSMFCKKRLVRLCPEIDARILPQTF